MALEVSGKYIRITLQHQGERIRFKWPEQSSEASLRAAKKAQDRIKRDLEDGTFRSIEDYLPHFARSNSFETLARTFLKTSTASLATRNEYRKALNYYWLPELADTDVSKLRPSHIKELIADIDFPSPKTRNNALIPLRKVLKLAHDEEFTVKDLSAFVKGDKVQTKKPDPFSQKEAQLIIDAASDRFKDFFEFMFYSGLRIGEAMGLGWESIDFNTKYMRIHETQTNGMRLDSTKTYREREVYLHPRALAALTRQKPHTLLMGDRVFMTEAGKPYITPKAQRKAWKAALRKAGIRWRPLKNTRHTYATYLLMNERAPYWVAGQMGHSLQVLLKDYARWMKGADDERQMAVFYGQSTDETTDGETQTL